MQPCSSDPAYTGCRLPSCLVPFEDSIDETQMNNGPFPDPAYYANSATSTIGALLSGQSEGNATMMTFDLPAVDECTTVPDLTPTSGTRPWNGAWEMYQPIDMAIVRPSAIQGMAAEERSPQHWRRIGKRPTTRTGKGNSVDKVRKLYCRNATDSQGLSAGKSLRANIEVSSAQSVQAGWSGTPSSVNIRNESLPHATRDEKSTTHPSRRS
jgi:hypothetical protein